MHRTGTAWRRVSTAVAVGAVLLVAGCGDEQVVSPSPSPSPPPPAATTPTPSPSPALDLTKLPEQPAAMAEPTPDGAIAAATYVLQLYGYSFAAGDTAPWRAITLKTCGFCNEVETAVNQMVEAGETSSGSTFVVTSSTASEISEDQWFSVDMTIRQSTSQRYDAGGSLVGSGTGGEHRAVFGLSWSDGWRVNEMGILPLESTAEATP